MNKSIYSLLAAVALVGAGAVPAHAAGSGDKGTADAAVLKAELDVSLLGKAVDVPLRADLNAVQAPGDANETTLTTRVEGAEGGKSIDMLSADVSTARATADEQRSEGYSNLVNAKVHVPGLPLLSVIEVEKATSKAVCEAGGKPTAESKIPGSVKLLGEQVDVQADGSAEVEVPAVGKVELNLAETQTTSRTAAATALKLNVSVDPAELGVAAVNGTVTLVDASCETPAGAGNGDGGAADGAADGGSADGGGNEQSAQTGDDTSGNLAETGGNSSTPYIAGGALALVAAGGALVYIRRRKA